MACSGNYFPPGQSSADINGFTVRYSDMQQLGIYADRVGSSDGQIPKTVRLVVLASLATNRITYCKKSQGDCGPPSAPGASFKIGTAVAKITAPALFGLVLGGILRHKQAVAIEQQTLCAIADHWNGFAAAMEAALSSGKLSQQDAVVQLKSAYGMLVGEVQGIEKPYNAAFHYHKALDALEIWNEEIVIPSLASFLSGLAGSLPRAALIGGGILVGAKLVGVL